MSPEQNRRSSRRGATTLDRMSPEAIAKELDMAMIRVEPVEVPVRTGWFDGTPREITWGEERLLVTRLAAVREEGAAFPVITGPRALFEGDTPRPRLALTFPHRSRRRAVAAVGEGRRAA